MTEVRVIDRPSTCSSLHTATIKIEDSHKKSHPTFSEKRVKVNCTKNKS